MSIDSSLKVPSGLAQHRNVLTRAERVQALAVRNQFDKTSDSPLALPKVENKKVVTGKKKKKAE
jgi:small basic protein (TIGR04137 family)